MCSKYILYAQVGAATMIAAMSISANATVSDGISKLLVSGNKVVTQQFTVRKEILLSQVKVDLQLRMTVSPEKASKLTKSLTSLKTPGGKKLSVTGIQQTMTNTGLVNLTAQITGHLPAAELADITALIKSHNKSGQRLTLLNTSPYFPDQLRQKFENKLSLILYRRAQGFLKGLNRIAKPVHYTAGSVSFLSSSVAFPRPVTMQRNFAMAASAKNNTGLQMQKVMTMSSSVIYLGQDKAQ